MGDTDAIGESVDENGVYRPIVACADGTILCGHHLYAALGERGGGSEGRVDVVVLDLEPMSDAALRIMAADNRTADLGRYDDALMAQLLTSLAETDAGLVGTGYEEDDLDELRAALRRAEHTPLGYEGPKAAAETPPGADSAAETEPAPGTYAADANRYESKGIRYVSLDFPLAQYIKVVEALGVIREREGLQSNSEVLAFLLGVPKAEEAS